MHFDQWPMWARPKDEQAGKTTPLSEVVADLPVSTPPADYLEALKLNVALAEPKPARKKPGPKPKAKP